MSNIKQLSDRQIRELTKEDLEKYQKGLRYCESEHAGQYDGWAEGHRLLEEVGYKKIRRKEGHRVFVSLEPPEEK